MIEVTCVALVLFAVSLVMLWWALRDQKEFLRAGEELRESLQELWRALEAVLTKTYRRE